MPYQLVPLYAVEDRTTHSLRNRGSLDIRAATHTQDQRSNLGVKRIRAEMADGQAERLAELPFRFFSPFAQECERLRSNLNVKSDAIGSAVPVVIARFLEKCSALSQQTGSFVLFPCAEHAMESFYDLLICHGQV